MVIVNIKSNLTKSILFPTPPHQVLYSLPPPELLVTISCSGEVVAINKEQTWFSKKQNSERHKFVHYQRVT